VLNWNIRAPPELLKAEEETMSKNTTLIWASYPSREAAEQAVHRLAVSGFSRNSIDLDRRDDGDWNVGVHTSEHNLERVQRLLHTSDRMFALNQFGGGVAQTLLSSPLVWAGAAALVGIAGYSLLPRNRRPTVHSVREFPGRIARTAQNLPETARRAARTMQDKVGELPGAVSDFSEAVAGSFGGEGGRQQGSDRR
jgi:hypothetical protein